MFCHNFATFGNILEMCKIRVLQRNLSTIFLRVLNIHLFLNIFQKVRIVMLRWNILQYPTEFSLQWNIKNIFYLFLQYSVLRGKLTIKPKKLGIRSDTKHIKYPVFRELVPFSQPHTTVHREDRGYFSHFSHFNLALFLFKKSTRCFYQEL